MLFRSIVEGVLEEQIPEERINDAVTRILTLKQEAGILDDPLQEHIEQEVEDVGLEYAKDIARQLVEKSQVLLKNKNGILPIKKKTKILVIGPAANDTGAMAGGWTYKTQGGLDDPTEVEETIEVDELIEEDETIEVDESIEESKEIVEYVDPRKYVKNGTTILDALYQMEDEYNLTILTDPEDAAKADLVLLCIGEKPYANSEGDTSDLSLTGRFALPGNEEAITLAKELNKKTEIGRAHV